MKNKAGLWLGAIAILLLALPYGVAKIVEARDRDALQEQLRLARADGIPTTWQEFAATIPAAAPAENAGPLYQSLATDPSLHGPGKSKVDLDKVDLKLIFRPDSASRSDAVLLLNHYKTTLNTIDAAAMLPKCNFNRDWSKGMAVLFREFPDMKMAAKLLALRASIATDRGDIPAALADVRRIFVIARHVGTERTPIAQLVDESIYAIGLRHLAFFFATHSDQPALREALLNANDASPRPDLKSEHRDELLCMLSMIDLCASPAGRRELGLKDENLSFMDRAMPLVINRGKAKVQLVKAERAYWKSLDQPRQVRADRMVKAQEEVAKVFVAWPTAADIYGKLTAGIGPELDRELVWEARRLQYVALLRALGTPSTPRTIKTSDLLSPFDHKPLQYKFDVKQMQFAVSGYEEGGKPIQLKVPPDSFFKP